MKPKDLVFDLFGDYIRYVGGSLRLGQLVELLGLFDVESATTRVTLSRMRQEGWVSSERAGREVVYSATARMLAMLDEGRERIFSPTRALWSGQWTAVLYNIPESRRSERERLKRQLGWEGFGQLNSTTWISPRDVRERVRGMLDSAESDEVHVFSMSTGSLEGDRLLAGQCWDLAELGEEYSRYIEKWEQWRASVPPEGVQPREALVARVELTTTYRRFLFRDPMLPTVLQPHDWPGDTAFATFIALHRELARPAMEQVLSTLGADDQMGLAGYMANSS